MRHLFPVLLAGGLVALLLPLACRTSSEPERPANIPDSVHWIGGADGGVFAAVMSDEGAPNDFRISIYHEDGSVWFEGPAELQPADAVLEQPLSKNALVGWDGSTLFLTDGRQLVAVSPSQ